MKKITQYKSILPIALSALWLTATPGQAQLTFEFVQQGANVVVTGSGSATPPASGGTENQLIGFTENTAGNTGPLYDRGPAPAEWLVLPANTDGFASTVTGSTLSVGGVLVTGLDFGSGGGGAQSERLGFRLSSAFTPATLISASGSATFNTTDFSSFFALYTSPTEVEIIPGLLRFCFGGPCPVAVIITPLAASGARRTAAAQSYLITDVGAIQSLSVSGLGMGLINQQVTLGAPNAALADLNNRLFRARSGREDAPAELVSTIGGDSSLLRYLAFTQDENMSYKVALGLADAAPRTIEINNTDTLAGQSLGGGLPYAMMGVPLMPMAGGAATVHIVEAAPSGKTVIDDSKAVVEIAPFKRWEIFVAGDFSSYDQDQLSSMMQGFDTTTYAGSVGLEYRVNSWLNLGLAWSYLQSDTTVDGNFGNIDLEGNLMSAYASAFWRQYWADVLYSYGSFNNDIIRNTGLGSRAHGDADSQSHNMRLNFGRNFNVGNNITTGPIAGLRYSLGDIDPYSERGGGSAALDYNGTDFESMVSRLGWQATHVRPTNWGRLVSQARLAWEHEYMPENGTVGASLQTSPFALVTGGNVSRFGGYSAEDRGATVGTDWLSAGAGLRFELANGVAFTTDYEGVFFRSDVAQHYASAKLSYEWGSFMPKGKGKAAAGSEKAAAYTAYDAAPEVVEVEEQEAVVEEKKSGGFAGWLARKGR